MASGSCSSMVGSWSGREQLQKQTYLCLAVGILSWANQGWQRPGATTRPMPSRERWAMWTFGVMWWRGRMFAGWPGTVSSWCVGTPLSGQTSGAALAAPWRWGGLPTFTVSTEESHVILAYCTILQSIRELVIRMFSVVFCTRSRCFHYFQDCLRGGPLCVTKGGEESSLKYRMAKNCKSIMKWVVLHWLFGALSVMGCVPKSLYCVS